MKTLGRILIILAAFVIVAGITYVAVDAGSSSTSANVPSFERGDGDFSPPSGERLEFPGGERDELRGGGLGWMFGFIKNIGMIAIIVTLITIPKNLKRRKTVPASVQS
jgi:hypothetical protein